MTTGRSEDAGGDVAAEARSTGDDEETRGSSPAESGVEATGQDLEHDVETPEVVVRRERDEYLEMLRRVQADFENYKKRMVRQQTDLLERAAEALVVRLLPVLDAFELARAHLEAEGSPEGKALLQAASLLSETLAKEGLERVDDEGMPFDPTVHEAVEHQPADEGSVETLDPVVSGVLRPGYRYKGRVVRPAMVRVRG